MTMHYVINNTAWKIDPTSHYSDNKPEVLAEACGIVPAFFQHENTPKTIKQLLQEACGYYGFPASESDGGNVDELGVYRYPSDPELYPLMQSLVCGIMVNIYEYGLVSIGGRVFRFD